MAAGKAKTRVRAVQQRAEDTRAKLLGAAMELFSTRGYEGSSVRDIETAAEVKRGLAAYHFGSKEELWKAAVARTFDAFEMDARAGAAARSGDDPLREALRAFVRFSAVHPELNRLMVQEGSRPGWRSEFLVERYVRPRVEALSRLVGRALDPHELYVLIGASTFVFNVAHECEALFGVDPRSEAFAEAHADTVAEVLLDGEGVFARAATSEGDASG